MKKCIRNQFQIQLNFGVNMENELIGLKIMKK